MYRLEPIALCDRFAQMRCLHSLSLRERAGFAQMRCLSSLSLWERAGVRVTARNKQHPMSHNAK